MYLNHSQVTFLTGISYLLGYHLAQDIFHVLFVVFFCFLLCFWILFLCFVGIGLGSFRRLVLRRILCYVIDGCLWNYFVSLFIGLDFVCLLFVKFRSSRHILLFLVSSIIELHFFVLHFHLIDKSIFYIQEFTPFSKNCRFRFHKNYYIFCTFAIFLIILNF